jgi:hypothetical protein
VASEGGGENCKSSMINLYRTLKTIFTKILMIVGYGNFKRHEKAHRISWRLYRGEIPVGLCAKGKNAPHKNFRVCKRRHDTSITGFRIFSTGKRRCFECYKIETLMKRVHIADF